MMKSIKFLVGLVASLIMFSGCEELGNLLPGVPGVPGVLELSDEEISFKAEGGSMTIGLASTVSWEAKSNGEWVTVSPSSGDMSIGGMVVTVTVEENKGEAREAEITFVTGSIKPKILKVKQTAADVPNGGDGNGEGEGEGGDEAEVKEVTIPEVLALEKDTEVIVKGHIVARYTHGFLMSDGTDLLLVYEAANASEYPVGSKVTVRALIDLYAGQVQLSRVVSIEAAGSQTVTHPAPTVYTSSNLSELLTRERPSYIQYTGTLSISTLVTTTETTPFYKFKLDGSDQELTIHFPLPEHEAELEGHAGRQFKITAYHIGVRTLTNNATQTQYQCINTMAVEVELLESTTPEIAGQGTLEVPYSPKEALDLGYAGLHDETKDIYVAGIISQIEEVSTQHGNATFYISADGTTNNQFQIFRTYYLNGEKFTSENQIGLGDKVVVRGKIIIYKNKPEIGQGGQIVKLESAGGGSGEDDGGNTGGDVNPGPGTGGGNVVSGWLELPAMSDNSGLEYYSHSFKMNGKEYRNYSFGWSQKDYVALWVAYPLCSMYTTKKVNRTDAWAYDPKLGKGKSSAPFGGYGGDYSRGHQVASSDRLCCAEANNQTFYGTNMTPQLQDLNGGKWEHLESQVRNLAAAVDTVYVVTGCIVKGSTSKVPDSDGNMMPVPVGYYKALLSYDASSTNNRWACAAFYFEHRKYNSSTSLKTVSMSVDDLEDKTGFDFFVNLKDKIGADEADRLEAQDPKTSTLWWSYIQ